MNLNGRRVLVTRPAQQARPFVEKLDAAGAVPVLFPAIEISELDDMTPLQASLERLHSYDWLIFTSVNGVDIFWKYLSNSGRDGSHLQQIRVAAIGPATAESLAAKGVRADLVPDDYVAEAIVPGLGDIDGKKILLPRAETARRALVESLQAAGAIPEEIAIYRTTAAQNTPQALAELEQGIDIATFTSSSTVRFFCEQLGGRTLALLQNSLIACIGPITAETAFQMGLCVHIMATSYTGDGLIQALLDFEID